MKIIFQLILLVTLLSGCDKQSNQTNPAACDINATYASNAAKPVISVGVFGTVSSMEGNCMPVVQPASSTCTHCPVSRTIRVHAYTRSQDAVSVTGKPGFFSRVNTPLVTEVVSDMEGFYQVALPAGQYSLFILENGMLHAASMDGNGGLNPIVVTSGKQKADLIMKYKATF